MQESLDRIEVAFSSSTERGGFNASLESDGERTAGDEGSVQVSDGGGGGFGVCRVIAG